MVGKVLLVLDRFGNKSIEDYVEKGTTKLDGKNGI